MQWPTHAARPRDPSTCCHLPFRTLARPVHWAMLLTWATALLSPGAHIPALTVSGHFWGEWWTLRCSAQNRFSVHLPLLLLRDGGRSPQLQPWRGMAGLLGASQGPPRGLPGVSQRPVSSGSEASFFLGPAFLPAGLSPTLTHSPLCSTCLSVLLSSSVGVSSLGLAMGPEVRHPPWPQWLGLPEPGFSALASDVL